MISLLIGYYKKKELLPLIFQGLEKQSYKDFEVIVAEDDNNPETASFLEDQSKKFSFPIRHVHQDKDDRFRKNQILNKAIAVSTGDKIVFTDGDCIPHKHFLKSYNNGIREGVACYGKRTKMGPTLSEKVIKNKDIHLIHFSSLLRKGTRRIEESFYSPLLNRLKQSNRGLLGCNWGILKKHLIEVNGFDEDYNTPGVGEDVDIEWRLKKLGINFKSLRNLAIIYHLYHTVNYTSEQQKQNLEILNQKKKTGDYFCKSGLEKHL